jgi:hypothetical protein
MQSAFRFVRQRLVQQLLYLLLLFRRFELKHAFVQRRHLALWLQPMPTLVAKSAIVGIVCTALRAEHVFSPPTRGAAGGSHCEATNPDVRMPNE